MEWFSELIGFLIVLFVFLLPLLRKLLIDRKKKKEPEEPSEEEEEIEEELEEPPSLKPPPVKKPSDYSTQRLVKKDFEFRTELEKRELESVIAERELETRIAPDFKKRIVSQAFILPTAKLRKLENPVVSAIKNKDPLQSMVILSEILGKPKGLE